MPRVTIGVPVYNGAKLIGECLANLAEQTYRDFEVIISDNASNDGTTEICTEFCARDRRFRHIIHQQTSSANENFQFVRDAADCDFFAYRAFDDLCCPNFLAQLVPVLKTAPDARLAVGSIRREKGIDRRVRLYRYPLSVAEDRGPAGNRVLPQMFKGHASWFYGLWRHKGLVESYERVLQEYDDPWGCDHLILLHAMLADGIRGTHSDATFIQRVLPTQRHYTSGRGQDHATVIDRNRRFEAAARQLLAESSLEPGLKRRIGKWMTLYTLHRCHGPARLMKALLRGVLKRS